MHDSTTISLGDCISLTYETHSAAGGLLETTSDREPLRVTVGDGSLVAGVERALIGLHVGERRRVAVQPEQAFGRRDPNLQRLVPHSRLPARLEPSEQLAIRLDGCELNVWVRAIEEDGVLLDANHPLAGEALIFDLEVLERHPPRSNPN